MLASRTMMKSGFLAGAAFAAGVIVGVFVPRPWAHDAAPPAPQAQTKAKTESFESLAESGNKAMDQKRYVDAIAAYDRALAIRFDPDVATDRGICLRELGQKELALAAFEFITLRVPDHWQAHYNRAVVLLQMDRIDAAREEAVKLKVRQPDNQSVRQLLEVIEQRSASH